MFTFAVTGHTGDWRDGNVVVEAAKLNQPLLGFYAAESCKGQLGKQFSLVSLEGSSKKIKGVTSVPPAIVCAIKKAENSNEIVVRLRETKGNGAENLLLKFASSAVKGREINGQEDSLGRAEIANGSLKTSVGGYQPRAFALTFSSSKYSPPGKPTYEPLQLEYNLDGISMDDNRADGDIDGCGNTLAGELLPDTVWYQGIPFVIGPKQAGAKNVAVFDNRPIHLRRDSLSRIYFLVLATERPIAETECYSAKRNIATRGTYTGLEGVEYANWCENFIVPNYLEPVGQWNNRMANGRLAESDKEISPYYSTGVPVAWYGTHYHNAKGENSVYQYQYLYAVSLPLLGQDPYDFLIKSKIKILAATKAAAAVDKYNVNQRYLETPFVLPASALYDQAIAAVAQIHCDHTAFIDSTMVRISSPTIGANLAYRIRKSGVTSRWFAYTSPFYVSGSSTIQAGALLKGHEDEGISSVSVQKLLPHEALTVAGTLPGLFCKYYEGEWQKLPNFDSLKVVKETITDSIAIPSYAKDSLYGLVMSGYIQIPSEGLYEFGLSSDDGSALVIGDSLVVDNDGLHGSGELFGQIALKPGLHPITIKMFQCKGDEALDLFIAGPGLPKQLVSRSMLVHQIPLKGKGKTNRQ